MRNRHQRREEGQSLVLVALMAVVLVAFTGLAIDGGNAYSQRRITQNAADGAAIRGAQTIADNLWQQNTNTTYRRNLLLQRINSMVELHGVPDTNGTAGDEINANVVAYYTDIDGEVFDQCTVAACTTIPEDTYGVEVDVSKPFDTYFTGVIGWNQMTVRARAIGLARLGRAGYGGNAWALYAVDGNGCNGAFGSNYEIDIGDISSNRVRGNTHSNGAYSIHPDVVNELPFASQITYVTNYSGPSTYLREAVGRDGLALPNFGSYYTLAQSGAQMAGGTYVPNPPTPPGYSRPTHVVSAPVGLGASTGTAPYTFINGDLVLTGTNASGILIGGLIVVNGNVLIDARTVSFRAPGASLLATGVIQITANNNTMNMRPFQDTSNPRLYDPLLDRDTWRTVLWSNADMAAVGEDPCNVPVIQDFGKGGTINGAILAMNGLVDMEGSGGARIYNGTIIADMIYGRGADRKYYFNSLWFPPQPDFVELME